MKTGFVVWLGLLFLYLPVKPQEKTHKFFRGDPHDSLQLMVQLDSARELYYDHKYDSTLLITDSLLFRSRELSFHRGIAEVYFLQARCFNRLGDKERAIHLFEQSFSIFEALNEYERMSSVCNNWAIVLKTQGRFAEAIEVGEMGLQYLNQNGYSRTRFIILNNLAISYKNIANYKKAISIFYESIDVLNGETDSIYKEQSEANIYMNLSNVYFDQKLYAKSLEINRYAESILERYDMKEKLALLYNNLGLVYFELNDLEHAFNYFQTSLAIYKGFNDLEKSAICISNIGKVYDSMGDFKSAINHFETALALAHGHSANALLPNLYRCLGNSFLSNGQISDSERALLNGLQISLETGQKLSELEIYLALTDFYKHQNDLKKALMYYDMYVILSSELNDQEIGRLIGQKELEGHIDKRDRQLQALQNKTSLLQFQIDRKNILLILSLLLITSISIIFIFIYRHNRLKASNRNISLEQKLLRSQLNPHFIFNALGAIQKYIYSKSPSEASLYLSKFAKLMRSILESSRNENPTLKQELGTIEDYLDLQSLRFQGNLKYEIEVDSNINLETTIPSMLVQPLVENAVKHGLEPREGNGKISIRISQTAQYISISVEDDGIGLTKSDHGVPGTVNRKGFGNIITQERLVLINKNRKQKLRFNLENLVSKHLNKSGTKAKLDIPFNI